ncbi:hypothetical protein M3Y94_00235400 [Aphelenchoides besseyi]|nr:hypothetical protein M3Y94_00235400 [Aphelenchoides besseyi]KAI6236398.1 Ubiquitin conjugating enzyme [Aphelenchoides besseyi]
MGDQMADKTMEKYRVIRTLQAELKSLKSEALEGFTVNCDEQNMFSWTVGLFGPPDTLYQGGYFKAILQFPTNYPFAPPSFRFITKIWHPNVYMDGNVCISILHSPGHDAHSGENATERWNPTQNVRTILLSIISLLNEPNISSPANVSASVAFKKWKETGGKSDEFAKIVKKNVEDSKLEAAKDGVKVPETVHDYCTKNKPVISDSINNYSFYNSDSDYDDF